MLILYNFTQIQKYFTLALLVLLVTNMMYDLVIARVDNICCLRAEDPEEGRRRIIYAAATHYYWGGWALIYMICV